MNTSIEILPYQKKMHGALLGIWQRGVMKTHDFLAREDYEFYNQVVDKEALPSMEVWVAMGRGGKPLGFAGINGMSIEMLFVDPDVHRMGVGTALLDFIVVKKGCIKVDVNEQNRQAYNFYRKYGFVECGRDELDDRGKPCPIIHLELADCLGKKKNLAADR